MARESPEAGPAPAPPGVEPPPVELGTWAWDAASGDVVWSEEMSALLSRAPPGSVDEALPPEARRRHRDELERAGRRACARAAERGGTACAVTPKMRLELEGPRLVDASAVAVASPEGLLRTWGVFMDVTEAVEARRRAEESEKRLRTAFDSVRDGLLLWRGGVVEECNQACEAMLDRPRDDLVGQPLEDLAPAEGSAEALAAAPDDRPRIAHLARGDGRVVEVEARTRASADRLGPIFVTTLVDLAAQRAAEAERSRLLAAVDQAAEAMVLCRADGDVLYANLAAAKMAGRPREDLVGNRLGELLHDAQATREVLQQLAIGAPWRKRFRSPSPDGQVRASEVRLSPVEGPRGVDTFVLTALDTSREDALERQLEHSQRLEALGTLAGGIAHDFNNVLNGVLGFTEVAAGMLEASHPAREVLDSSLKGIARARSLVEQILTFSRRVSPTLDAVRLAEVAEDGTSFLRASLPPHVDLTLHVDPSAGAVLADPHQLQQVLTNLCTNAYQAKGTTRIVVRVDEVRRARRGESAPLGRLVVEDDGEGMPPEVRDRIFEPFFTTKGSAGSGMGLAVCHGIIEGHRGFIEVDSAIGRGTRVEIYLPAAPDVDEQSEPARRPAPPPICPSGRVLLVDDEPQVLEVARLHLTGAGLEVEAHEDPIEALAAFASAPESFHVVATDLSMPKLAGDELARRIREFRPELNILLLSGVTASLDEETVEAFSAILPKPFTREALIETVARLIE